MTWLSRRGAQLQEKNLADLLAPLNEFRGLCRQLDELRTVRV